MKKIINGKRYDTEKAEYIGEASYSNPGDFNHWTEELYRKRTGEYFLYGAGGPSSKYAVRVELNSWSGGEKLVPITYEEAKEWVEKYLEADKYEELFGVVEDLSRTSITLSVPMAAADMLRRESAKTGKSISDIASDLILANLNK